MADEDKQPQPAPTLGLGILSFGGTATVVNPPQEKEGDED